MWANVTLRSLPVIRTATFLAGEKPEMRSLEGGAILRGATLFLTAGLLALARGIS